MIHSIISVQKEQSSVTTLSEKHSNPQGAGIMPSLTEKDLVYF